MKKLIAIAVAALTLVGCATGPQYYVETNSLAADHEFEGATYHLWPMDPEINPGDLQYQEFARQVERALDINGMERVAFDEQADMLVMMGYGIGTPRTEMFSYVVPVRGVTGTTTTTQSSATVTGIGNTLYGTGTSNSNTQVQRGTVGYSTQSGARTVFDRFLLLNGRVIDAAKEMSDWATVFETTVTSTGSSDDLRRVLPVMIAAASDKVTIDTGRKVRSILTDTDDIVLAIRGASKE